MVVRVDCTTRHPEVFETFAGVVLEESVLRGGGSSGFGQFLILGLRDIHGQGHRAVHRRLTNGEALDDVRADEQVFNPGVDPDTREDGHGFIGIVLGGAVGASVFGAIIANRLARRHGVKLAANVAEFGLVELGLGIFGEGNANSSVDGRNDVLFDDRGTAGNGEHGEKDG